jgi:beta-phosphoglucomutase
MADMGILGVIFDLDGVLVRTDELHFRCWKELAEREGIPFSRTDNERLRGVNRMESLEIVLERSPDVYTGAQKLTLAEQKNARYRELLRSLGPSDALPGVRAMLVGLRERGILTAVGSSSRNAPEIVARIGLESLLDVVVGGDDVARSKPDPEVFILAARRLGLDPGRCLVVEDAAAGIEAAIRGGFPTLGIGDPSGLGGARRCVPDLASISIDAILAGGRSA